MNNNPKTEYSELQAAATLGVTVEELRALVRQHIVKDGDPFGASLSIYQAADLVVLRILSRMARRQPVHV